MRGLTSVLGELALCILSVYIDYQMTEFDRPLNLVRKAALARKILTCEEAVAARSMGELLQAITCKRRFVIFFADEVQQLYLENVEEGHPRCAAVRDLLTIGKADNSMGIVAGSTASLRSLTFRNHLRQTGGGLDPYDVYPDLNHTVFSPMQLRLLRTAAELRGVLEQKRSLVDGAVEVTEAYVHAVFEATGGVGRLNSDMTKYVSAADYDNKFIDAFEGVDVAYRVVMSRLFVDDGGFSENPTYELWGPNSLRMSEIRLLFEAYSIDVQVLVNSWVDGQLVYVDKSARVEFFCARHFNTLCSCVRTCSAEVNQRRYLSSRCARRWAAGRAPALSMRSLSRICCGAMTSAHS
jgi:hypothetical protein